MNIFVMSDPHFCHNKDFIFQKRGFSSIVEHNEILIQNHNSVVKPEDVIYCVGDWSWGDTISFFMRMKGSFHYIKGNHDKNFHNILKGIMGSKILSYTPGYLDVFIDKTPVTFNHFPMVRWEKSHFGAWHIFGHVHSDWCPPNGKIMNATLDALHNFPISWEDIKKYMKNRNENEDLIVRK